MIDDRLVRVMLQWWLTRICEDHILLQDEEVRSFIDSDWHTCLSFKRAHLMTSPVPTYHLYRTKSGLWIQSHKVWCSDEDKELQQACFELTHLETQYFDSAKAVDRLAWVQIGKLNNDVS